MKSKFFCLVLFSFFSSFNSFAQNEGPGLRVSLISSNIKFKYDSKTQRGKPLNMPAFGVVAYRNLSKKFGAYTDFGFLVFTGTNYTDTMTIYDNTSVFYTPMLVEYKERLRMVSFTCDLLLVYKFNKSFFTMAGPQLNAYVDKHYKEESGGASRRHLPATNYIVNSDHPIFAPNFTFGIGHSNGIFRGDIRYNLGIFNLFEKDLQLSSGNVSVKRATCSSLQFSLVMIFPRTIYKQ